MILELAPILLYLAGSVVCNEHHPQVHENVDEKPRIADIKSKPFKNLPHEVYIQPVFQFQNIAQQDKLKWRYSQQQQVDAINLAKRYERLKHIKDNTSIPTASESKRQETTERYMPGNKSRSTKQPGEGELQENVEELISDVEIKKIPRTNKTLKPENFSIKPRDDLQQASSENHENVQANPRQDYVSLQMNPSGATPSIYLDGHIQDNQNIAALNSLIGKHPDAQLQGLNQLLSNQAHKHPLLHTNTLGSPQEVYTGIQKTHDTTIFQVPFSKAIPLQLPLESLQIQTPPPLPTHFQPPPPNHNIYGRPDTVPAIFSQNGDIAKIQEQLDATARQQIEKALATAHAEAARQVEAQHKALAAAQAQAQVHAIAEGERQARLLQANSQAQVQARVKSLALTNIHATKEQAQIRQEANVNGLQGPQWAISQLPHNLKALQSSPHIKHRITHGSANENKIFVAATEHQSANKYAHSSNAEVQKYFLKQDDPSLIEGTDGKDIQYAAKYAFGYQIKDYETGNNYGHEETRDGDQAKGRYRVLLPDGRVQNVEYYVDPTGYHAKVTYETAGH